MQWIQIILDDKATLSMLKIQFQGGFAGKDCQLLLETGIFIINIEGEKQIVIEFYPLDNNKVQISFYC